MSGATKEGPYGVSKGVPFDIDSSQNPQHSPKILVAIQLWTWNGEISAIKFTYEDEGGQQIIKGPFGRIEGAVAHDPINIPPAEAVKTVLGSYNGDHITSITVNTTGNSYGPYGKEGPHPFTTINENILAFFGKYSDNGVNSIGTYYPK